MRTALALALASLLPTTAITFAASAGYAQPSAAGHKLVHVSLLNLSGKLREVSVHHAVIALPVAQPVVLQLPAGTVVHIGSATDTCVSRTLVVQASEEGSVIPVN